MCGSKTAEKQRLERTGLPDMGESLHCVIDCVGKSKRGHVPEDLTQINPPPDCEIMSMLVFA